MGDRGARCLFLPPPRGGGGEHAFAFGKGGEPVGAVLLCDCEAGFYGNIHPPPPNLPLTGEGFSLLKFKERPSSEGRYWHDDVERSLLLPSPARGKVRGGLHRKTLSGWGRCCSVNVRLVFAETFTRPHLTSPSRGRDFFALAGMTF